MTVGAFLLVLARSRHSHMITTNLPLNPRAHILTCAFRIMHHSLLSATRKGRILMLSNLRQLLRILPCHAKELPNFRGYVIQSARARLGKPAPNKNAELTSEALFLLRAQQHLRNLNIKYFPQSGMSEREVIEATAKRVGASSGVPFLGPPRSSLLASLTLISLASVSRPRSLSQASTCQMQRRCPSRRSPRPLRDGDAR